MVSKINLVLNLSGTVACHLLAMLTCVPLMTSSHSEGLPARSLCKRLAGC